MYSIPAESVAPTCGGAIVGDEAGHVHGLAVDGQVPHAAHKVAATHREVLRKVGNATQQQRTSQVQRPAHAKTQPAAHMSITL